MLECSKFIVLKNTRLTYHKPQLHKPKSTLFMLCLHKIYRFFH